MKVWRPIAFYSAKLKDAERRYPIHEHEMLSIVKAMKFFRCYIHVIQFLFSLIIAVQFFQDQEKVFISSGEMR